MKHLEVRSGYLHPLSFPAKGKILLVIANPAISTQTGWPVGYWASELTHPYKKLTEAGYEVVLASPQGGAVEMDAYSDPRHESGYSSNDVITSGFLQSADFINTLQNTLPISKCNPDEMDAILLIGGQSPMFTFRGNKALEKIFLDFHEKGKASAAVCHATALLLDLKTAEGNFFMEGKTWTGFADEEESYVDQFLGLKLQPY